MPFLGSYWGTVEMEMTYIADRFLGVPLISKGYNINRMNSFCPDSCVEPLFLVGIPNTVI